MKKISIITLICAFLMITTVACSKVTKYTLMYDLNGASGKAIEEVVIEEGQEVSIGKYENVFVDGVIFIEWNSQKDGKGQSFKANDKLVITKDTKLYAIWEVQTFHITFDAVRQDVTNLPQNITVDYGKKAIKPTKPASVNFNFVEWYDDSNGNDKKDDDESYFDFSLAVKKDYNLKADWVERFYADVDYDEAKENEKVYADENSNLAELNNLNKESFNFKGYYIDINKNGIKDSDEDYFDFSSTLTENIKLKAHFVAIRTIAFTKPIGIKNVTIPDKIEDGNTINFDFELLPSYSNSELVVKINNEVLAEKEQNGLIFKYSYVVNGSITITLHGLAINSYTISYNANGGNGVAPSNQVGNMEDDGQIAPSANELSMGNHRFLEWNTKADGSGITYSVGDTISATENMTLYAIWWDFVLIGGEKTENIGALNGTNINSNGDYLSINSTTGTDKAGFWLSIPKNMQNFAPHKYVLIDVFIESGVTDLYMYIDESWGGSEAELCNTFTNLPTGQWITLTYYVRTGFTVDNSQKNIFFKSDSLDACSYRLKNMRVASISKYTVSYKADGDMPFNQTFELEYGATVNVPEIPTKEGFNGVWNINLTNIKIDRNFSVVAEYTLAPIPKYYIIYDGNGNTSGTTPLSQNGNVGTSVTLANKGDLKNDATVFMEWNTKADGTGTSYPQGASVTDLTAGELTLYAIWWNKELFNGTDTANALGGTTCSVKEDYLLISSDTGADSAGVWIGINAKYQDKFTGNTYVLFDIYVESGLNSFVIWFGESWGGNYDETKITYDNISTSKWVTLAYRKDRMMNDNGNKQNTIYIKVNGTDSSTFRLKNVRLNKGFESESTVEYGEEGYKLVCEGKANMYYSLTDTEKKNYNENKYVAIDVLATGLSKIDVYLTNSSGGITFTMQQEVVIGEWNTIYVEKTIVDANTLYIRNDLDSQSGSIEVINLRFINEK